MTAPGQVRHAFPAFKVYIYGVDVTEDVLDVNINWNTGRAPNTCKISLANERDRYIFTTEDFKAIFRGNQDIVDAARRSSQFDAIAAGREPEIVNEEESIEDVILDNVQRIGFDTKRRVLLSKLLVRTNLDIPAQEVSGDVTSLNVLKGKAFRYPFQAEDPIFHPNDPIRIFFRDPFSPARWFHMFAGFIGDFDDNVDENNQKILTVGGEGPSKLLRYARITTNPGILDINSLSGLCQASADEAVLRTVWNAGFAGLTLPEFIFLLIFGHNPEDDTKFSIRRDTLNGTSVSTVNLRGVGNFNFKRSGALQYGPSSSGGSEDALQSVNIQTIPSLAAWQSLIDHEVKITDIDDMAIDTADLATLQSRVINFADGTPDPRSIIDIIGLNPHLFPVDGGRVLLLLPASLHPSANREVLLKTLINSFKLQTEFASRLGMIYDTVDRIEFLFYESPKGDLICEFPLYDFDPDDWQLDTPISHWTIQDSILGQANDVERGPFGNRYIIRKRDTFNFSRQITDEKVRTQMLSHWYTIQNQEEVATSREYAGGAVITLCHLVPLYGLRLEQVDPKGFIATKEAAHTFAHISLNKMNADSRNLGINALPNFALWLNRPIFFSPRNSIATTQSLNHSIKWGMGGSADTRVNVNYVRAWGGDLDSAGNPVYTPIGGIPSRPLDYKLLFNLKDSQPLELQDAILQDASVTVG